MNATEASRRFSELLDAVERGEEVTVIRGGKPVAEIRAPRRRTGRDLAAALKNAPSLDPDFGPTLDSGLALLEPVENPWAET